MSLGLATNLYEGGDTKRKMNPALYAPFGKYAQTAFQQGWMPETSSNGTVSYKSSYNSPFNDIVIPNSKDKGYLSLIGNGNQKFDVVIKNKNGDIVHAIAKGVSPDAVQTYLTNGQSNVAQRQQDIANSNNYGTSLFGL